MKVQNMTSAKEGNKIANQFIISHKTDTKYTVIFQSYGSVIARIINGKVYLDKDKWNYSTTTGKYRNQFLGETKAETQKKIDSGEYKLVNLN